MGILDDVLQQLSQQAAQAGSGQSGNQSGRAPAASGGGSGDSPLVSIFEELLLGKPQGGSAAGAQQQAEAPQARPAAQQGGAQQGQGGAADFGGLGGLLAQLQASGLDDVVRSWVGTGENKPVHPDDLGDALGKKAVGQMADQAGVKPDDLLTQLAKALPGIIDQLTRDGRVPTPQEVNQRLRG